MPDVAIIGHLQRLWPPYKFTETDYDYFSINLSVALLNPTAGAALDEARLKNLLLPYNWRAAGAATPGQPLLNSTDITFKVGYFPPGSSSMVSIDDANIEFVPFGTPDSTLNGSLLTQILEYHLKQNLMSQPDLSGFGWNSSQVGEPGSAGTEAFRNILGYYSTLCAPIPYGLDLTLCFRVKHSAFAAVASGSTLYAAPVFANLLQDTGGKRLIPTAASNLVQPTVPVSPFQWAYVIDTGSTGTPSPNPATYTLYEMPWSVQPSAILTGSAGHPVVDPNSLLDPSSYFVCGNGLTTALAGSDWAARLTDQLGDGFHLARRIVEAARNQQGDILMLQPPASGEVEDNAENFIEMRVCAYLRSAVLAAIRDNANPGLFPAPDTESMVDAILDRVGGRSPGGPGDLLKWQRAALRAALVRYDRDVTLDSWRILLTSTISGVSNLRVLLPTQSTSNSQFPMRSRASFSDELAELDALISAAAEEETLRKVILTQWSEAALSKVMLPRPAGATPVAGATLNTHAFFDVYPRPLGSHSLPDGPSQSNVGALDFGEETAWRVSFPMIEPLAGSTATRSLRLGLMESTITPSMNPAVPDSVSSIEKVALLCSESTDASGALTSTITVQVAGTTVGTPIADLDLSKPFTLRLVLARNSAADAWNVKIEYPRQNTGTTLVNVGDFAGLSTFACAWVKVTLDGSANVTAQFSPVTVSPTATSNVPALLLSDTAARDLWGAYSNEITTQIVPGLNVRRRLSLGNIGRIWISRLVPSHDSSDADILQIQQNVRKSLKQYFGERVNGLDSYEPYSENRPILPQPSAGAQATVTAIANLILQGIDSFCDRFNAQIVPGTGESNSTLTPPVDDESPTPKSQPLVLQFDRVTQGGADPATDQSDLQRQHAGVCVFLRADRTSVSTVARTPGSDKWRTLNMAKLCGAIPRRLTPFDLASAETLRAKIQQSAQLTADWQKHTSTQLPADSATMLTYLNSVPAPADPIFIPTNWSDTVLPADTSTLLTHSAFEWALMSDDNRRIARWWLLQDSMRSSFDAGSTSGVIYPTALIPSRVTYRNGLRQAFIQYDNQPLIAPSPMERITQAYAPTDPVNDSPDQLLFFQLADLRGADAMTEWALFPALMDGMPYSFLAVTPTNSGALPVNLVNAHPARLAVRSAAKLADNDSVSYVSNTGSIATRPLSDYRRTTKYLRRRGIGAAMRCNQDRVPLDGSNSTASGKYKQQETSKELLRAIDNVAPLAKEFPGEIVTSDDHKAIYFFDDAARAGTLALGQAGISTWTTTVERVYDSDAPANSDAMKVRFEDTRANAVLQPLELNIRRGKTGDPTQDQMELSLTRLASATVPSTTILGPVLAGAWPHYYDVRLTLSFTTASGTVSLAVQLEGGGWKQIAAAPIAPGMFDTTATARMVVEMQSDAPGRLPVVFSKPNVQIDGDTIAPREPDRPLVLLPHPDLTNSNVYTFYVAPPTVDLHTWDRWRARDQESDATVSKDRVNVLNAFHNPLAAGHDPNSTPTEERSLDDPSIDSFVMELVQTYPVQKVSDTIRVPIGALDSTAGGLKFKQSKPVAITVTRDPGTTVTVPQISGPAAGQNTVQVKLPQSGLFSLRIYPAVQSIYFDSASNNRRFPTSFALEKRTFTYTAQGGAPVNLTLFEPLVTTLETASYLMPEAQQIWDAVRLDRIGSKISAYLDRNSAALDSMTGGGSNKGFDVTRFDNVHSVVLKRQSWRWDGRPVPKFPVHERTNLDTVPEPNDTEQGAVDSAFLWDAQGYGSRGDDDNVVISTAINQADLRPLLFDQDLSIDERARYLRFALEAHSRYEGLGNLLFTNTLPAVVVGKNPLGSESGQQRSEIWRRLLVPCRWAASKPVPKPRIKFLVPLTQGDAGSSSLAILVVLREPWYAEGGLSETLEAEIITVQKAVGPATKFPEYGDDVILTNSGSTGDAPTLDTSEFIGYTFDTDSTEPLFLSSSAVMTLVNPLPVPAPSQAKWPFARVLFRRRLDVDSANNDLVQGAFTPDSSADQYEITFPAISVITAGYSAQVKLSSQSTSTATVAIVKSTAGDAIVITASGDSGSGSISIPVAAMSAEQLLDLRIVLRRKSAAVGNPISTSTWQLYVYCRTTYTNWIASKGPAVQYVSTGDINVTTQATVGTLPATHTVSPVTLPTRSDPTDPYWVQFLPDAGNVLIGGSTSVTADLSTLMLKKATNASFTLATRLQPSTPVVLDMSIDNSMRSAGGRNLFEPYLLVTQIVTDARGRANQEKYVGLYRMNAIGTCYPLGDDPAWSGDSHLARKLVMQRRLEKLPGSLASSMQQFYDKLNLSGTSTASALWDIQLHSVMSDAPGGASTDQVVQMTIQDNADGVSTTAASVSATFDSYGNLTRISSPQGFVDIVVPAGSSIRACDLRIRILRNANQTEWTLNVYYSGDAAQWIPLVPTAPANVVSINQTLKSATLVVSISNTSRTVTYLPPSLTAEPWDHAFPVTIDPIGSANASAAGSPDVLARIVSVSPPLNGADKNTF